MQHGMSTSLRVDIFSDTVCPWCFLGKRRFERALAERPSFQPRVVWRPFELNPELPPEGVPRREYLAAKFGDPARLAAAEDALIGHGAAVGIAFRFDLIERVPNTRASHLLIAHAARRGLQGVVKDRIMRAYFEEGCHVGDLEELVRLGVESGLPEHETRAALVLRAGQDGVVAAQRHAALLGITGVPTFVFNGQHSLAGAQEVGTFVQVFDRVEGLLAERAAAT